MFGFRLPALLTIVRLCSVTSFILSLVLFNAIPELLAVLRVSEGGRGATGTSAMFSSEQPKDLARARSSQDAKGS